MTTMGILKLFSIIGILDTAYLLWHKFQGTDVACIGFPKAWCRKVQYSKQSVTFGVPNSVWGFLMYAAIFFLIVMQPAMPFWPIQALVIIGFLFSTYFMYVQGFVLRAFCTWCVVSFINFTVMAWALFVR
jgi:uncharacterized membrane protein